MIPVKGYAAPGPNSPLVPFDFERRELNKNDVLIDIQFCGICHSDIHQVKEEWGSAHFPMVPGHEIVGIVRSVGENVKKYKPGDKVGVGCMVDSCRHCENCTDDLEQFCLEKMVLTYNDIENDGKTVTQGGYSKCIVVQEDFVLRIPDNLPMDAAAPLLCAGITLYSPLKYANVGPGSKVAIIGLGGLGHMGIKIAHALGADVTVLSHSLHKKDDATRLGANHFYATSDPKTFEILQNHFDVIINTVSASIDWNLYLSLLKTQGKMIIVGIPDKDIPIKATSLIFGRKSVTGSLIGGLKQTQEMLDFCGKNNIVSDIELISIDKVNEAYERVIKSDVRYRFVIDLNSF